MRAAKEPTLPFLVLLASGAAAVGSFIVWDFGSSRLGDPNVCEGLAFGCSPSQLIETLVVMGVLWASLLAAAVVARFASRHRLPVLAAGIVLAGGGTFAKWNADVIRYSVPALTARQARQEMDRLLAGLSGAAGPGDPSHVPAGVKIAVASPPSPADVLRSVEPEPAVPCLDSGGRLTGSWMLVWSRTADVLVPLDSLGPPRSGNRSAGTPPVSDSLPREHVEQVKRVGGALRNAGFELMEQRSGPTLEKIRATREGPALAERREGRVSTTYRVHVQTGLSREGEDSAEVTSVVQLETPCFRQ